MSATDLSSAPYVGPRSFTAQETLYGREREARELRALLISERIVLLYSPSGAGKTSLLNARVIPELEARQFAVQPVLRVSLGAPAAGGNRYLDSLALSLQPRAPGGADTPSGLPAGASLAAFLDARPSAASPGGEVLIFDQFEEILTLDPTDIAAKEQFFREVGAALRRPNRWALFSMREDYVAALDPYLRHLPTRLSCTFRLDLLGRDGAAEAIARPAREQRGVAVAPEVVQGLVHNLSLVQVQRADGSSSQEPGPYVEPVQLQVVCLRMWEEWLRRRAPGAATIAPSDVDARDSVGDALRDYYERRVREVAAGEAEAPGGARASERAIRAWFDRHLITPGGIRGQVLKGHERTEGLANPVIARLVDAYLVRSERRGGRTWYELAHDRLIDPVRESNAEWRRANLVPAQARAAVWEEQGRPEGLLLRGAELRAAATWSRGADVYVTALEQEYLAACRRLARARAINLALVAAIAVLAVLATVAAARAVIARNEATARQLAAQSAQALEGGPQRALLLAAEAADRTRPFAPLPEAARALYAALAATGGTPLAAGGTPLVAVAAAGPLVAAAGEDGVVYLWRDADQAAEPLAAHEDALNDVALSPDGRLLASAGDDRLVVWDLAASPPAPRPLDDHGTSVVAVAFSPDGRALASADDSGGVLLWDPRDLARPPARLAGLEDRVRRLAFSPDGARLAAGGDDGSLLVWDPAAPRAPVARSAHDSPLTALAFGPGGALVVGHRDGLVRVIDLAGGEAREVAGLNVNVRAVALSPDGALVAAGNSDGLILVWGAADISAAQGGRVAPLASLSDHRAAVTALAFSPDGAALLSTSADGTLRLRPVADLGSDPIVLRGHDAAILDALLDAAPATASADGTARRWDPATLSPVPWLRGHAAPIGALQYTPDGAGLISADLGGAGLRWSAAAPGAAPAPLHAPVGGAALLAYSRDGRYLAAVAELTLRLWDLQGGGEPRVLLDGGDEISALAFSPDGATLAAGTTGGEALLFATGDAAAAPRALPRQDQIVKALAFSPDGARLAVGDSAGAVRVWPFPALTGAPPPVVAHEAGVAALAFSPDGRALASGDLDGVIRLWPDGGRGAPGAALRGHAGAITALAFSPDGAALASAGLDGLALLWNPQAPDAEPTALEGHGFGLTALAFSPDARTLATGDNAGRLRLWPTAVDALRELACAAAGRNLSRAEWAQAFRDTPYRPTCPALPSPRDEVPVTGSR